MALAFFVPDARLLQYHTGNRRVTAEERSGLSLFVSRIQVTEGSRSGKLSQQHKTGNNPDVESALMVIALWKIPPASGSVQKVRTVVYPDKSKEGKWIST